MNNVGVLSPEIELLRKNDNDDDFFHITCHIDQNLRMKIEKGEYVDLERLLSKDSASKPLNEEKIIELVNRGGATFFAPVQERETKINSIRKWEQAFRVYAAIYTRANPECASEISQYVYVINTATSSYQWDNVAYYDVTFRQLMVFKPWRSWAKTYVQGWNLAMKDPIGKNSFTGSRSNNSHGWNGNNSNGNSNGNRDWCDDCCWGFNKNRCKNGKSCNFDHRCTYCGGWGHGYFNCRKRLNKNKDGHNSNTSRKHDGNSLKRRDKSD